MAHTLRQLQFEGVKVRATLIKHSAYGAKVGIERIGGISCIGTADEVAIDVYLWPQIPGGSFRRDYQIGFIHAEGLVHAARPHVGNHSCQVRSGLVLDIEVPLRDVITLLMRINKSGTRLVPGDVRGWHERESERGLWRRGVCEVTDFERRILEKRNGLSL